MTNESTKLKTTAAVSGQVDQIVMRGEQNNTHGDVLTILFIVLPWLAGTVLAKGFWSTTVAVFFPPYAWYLVVERALVSFGWAGA